MMRRSWKFTTRLLKKMSRPTCQLCDHNGYRYEFSTSTADFHIAKQNCANNNGTLARYLDEEAYLKWRKCCRSGFNYWIGLFENRNCSGSPIGPYSWVENTTCTSGSPLIIIPLENSAESSQAVSVLLSSNDLESPPSAKESRDYERTRYICQYSLAASTSPLSTTVSANDITSFSTIADASSSAETTITETAFTPSTVQSQESTGFSSTVTSTNPIMTSTAARSVTDVDDPTGLIVGLAVGGILLIIALLLFYFFFYKNGYYKKFKSATSRTASASFTPKNGKESNTKEMKENPLYGRYEINDILKYKTFCKHW